MATAPTRTPQHSSQDHSSQGPESAAPLPQSHDHPTLEQIAAEAYAIYMANGGQHGRDLDDWLEAERRLRSERA